jgi:hypothetical protein
MTSQDTERLELDRAIDLLGRSTRHGRLLEFLGSKYLSQQEAQLTEFDIAREVFGRSLENFDPAEDAVVRVETHRLRKKLRHIYEKDARANGVRISLPAGTYVPKFSTVIGTTATHSRRFPAWGWAAAAVAGAALVGIFLVTFSRNSAPQASKATSGPASAAATSAVGQTNEVHIIAGYNGSEVIDNSGTRWTPDQYFTKGGTWSRPGGFVRGTSRPFLFKTWRTGEFGYDIPMAPDNYELRLFFVSGQPPGDDKLSSFNVTLNGQPLLSWYDINASANGPETADEQVFRDVRPSADGMVRLWFHTATGSPVLNALELSSRYASLRSARRTWIKRVGGGAPMTTSTTEFYRRTATR